MRDESPLARFQVESSLTLGDDGGMAMREPSAQVQLTVSAVARRIGVAPATLRTWDRRYGVGPSDHSEGEHRRYSEADLARLIHMRKLIVAGVPPLEAAKSALAFQGELHGDLHGSGEIVEHLNSAPKAESERELVEQLLRAAKSLDREFIEVALQNYLDATNVERTWELVMCPLLTIVGDQWRETGDGIEVEHLLSDLIIRLLISRVSPSQSPINPRPVLIASIGEETHSLAITALAASLAERNISFHFLGARTPQSALNEVVRRSAPPAIFLWAQLRKHADSGYVTDLPVLRPKPRVIVGGPGWKNIEVKGADIAVDLASACAHIESAIGL
jgi:MerR family transcriptional regulator, light-induced transcriptional regulator